MLQVHDQDKTQASEIVNIDIADNCAISPKVRLVNFAVSRAARVQFSQSQVFLSGLQRRVWSIQVHFGEDGSRTSGVWLEGISQWLVSLIWGLFSFCSLWFLISACVCWYVQKELENKPNCPHMCAYKRVEVNFNKFGLRGFVEDFIHKVWNYFGLLVASAVGFDVDVFSILTPSLCVCRWKNACSLTSTDSCSAGSTSGSI